MARNRLNVTRGFGVITKGFAKALDSVVDALIEFDVRVRGPQATLKLFSSDELAGFFEKDLKDLERLVLEPDAEAMLAQFACAWVQFEGSEPDRTIRGEAVVGHEICQKSVARSVTLRERQDHYVAKPL